ncbi:MAG TPA: hypothetical protein VGO43_01510 [Pyrinomonadaceae bacterium]|jgi:hypothetical protein|nr:hypothetical protein [Pyrinomonadaceae bacterium]
MELLTVGAAILIAASTIAGQTDQLPSLVAQLQKTPADNALREKIIKLASSITPSPAVPDEALKFEGRGRFAFNNSTSLAEVNAAADEYEKAVAIAPWIAGYYSDLCKIYEKAKRYPDAKRNCGFYLVSLTDRDEINEVKARMAGLDYGIEKAGDSKVQADKVEAEENAAKQFIGTWARTARDGGGTSHTIRERVERVSASQWRFTQGMDGSWFDNDTRGIHDIRFTRGQLHFLRDDLIMYPDGPIICGVYEVTVTVSSDANRLTWDEQTTPLAPNRSMRCPLPKYFASSVWEYRRAK